MTDRYEQIIEQLVEQRTDLKYLRKSSDEFRQTICLKLDEIKVERVKCGEICKEGIEAATKAANYSLEWVRRIKWLGGVLIGILTLVVTLLKLF